ncbi:AraC family transcriptional regulator [Herbaspirillum sp. YR522]|uniref:helix-turn-helix domain-containing protein n=1 Tax=Herbaspirillum sp. YR522 TaxID=1144342 RepID=UPI00026F5300|nr:AraC family transcriptional regulator [Herbaspirillum sp. YR522]EJN10310.1 DNA-binding domain-containing protein, AraC-type [Herbaspirillum sp. YR522]
MTTTFQTTIAALDRPAPAPDGPYGQLRFGAQLCSNGVSVYRKRYDSARRLHITSACSGSGYLLGVSMTGAHQRRIIQGELAGSHRFSRGDIYLRDLQDPYAAEVATPFDFTLFEFPRSYFEGLVHQHVTPAGVALAPIAARSDPVLQHLTHALLPSLACPSQASALFVDQLLGTMATYLLRACGGTGPERDRPGVLSRVHAERAKALLLARNRSAASIADIARQCNMSVSYFMKAFKKTTGQTPHQWVLSQRLAQAREYLSNSALSLAEVAANCDFHDQSHFHRMFVRGMGVSPGAWRRQAA